MAIENVKTKRKVEIQDKIFYKIFLGVYTILLINLIFVGLLIPIAVAYVLIGQNVLGLLGLLLVGSIYLQSLVAVVFQMVQKFFYKQETGFLPKLFAVLKENLSLKKLAWRASLSAMASVLIVDFIFVKSHFALTMTIPVLILGILTFFIAMAEQVLAANGLNVATFKAKLKWYFYYSVKHFPLFLASLALLALVWTSFEWKPFFTLLFLPSAYVAFVLFINQTFIEKIKNK
ncbi:hypothetical protein Hs30E_00690 [Lactococcus hodotermopsidis]|uniref:Uncharacterized protein n=1 Tax=Pseudolactococcus hodotermopsidis TaxID=2709157 RepID=A0A6A0BAN8_9LACT|nr:hypothetical protein [Lactococcus hodotermopsidis]GFH41518.1 hypothetical protein Hs30E_00690 [Lactococcus hodotermopsidis]